MDATSSIPGRYWLGGFYEHRKGGREDFPLLPLLLIGGARYSFSLSHSGNALYWNYILHRRN